MGGGRPSVTTALFLVHGDDGFGIDQAVAAFAVRVEGAERTEIVPERSPDEAAIDRARIESATVGIFGAGRSSGAGDKLLALVTELPEGAALALAELRPSRDVGKPPALLKRLAD